MLPKKMKFERVEPTLAFDPLTIHPGEILFVEFMEPYGVSINRLAKMTRVATMTISRIVNGKRGITAETSIRLGKCFRMSDNFFLNIQEEYDIRVAKAKISNLDEVEVLAALED